MAKYLAKSPTWMKRLLMIDAYESASNERQKYLDAFWITGTLLAKFIAFGPGSAMLYLSMQFYKNRLSDKPR